MVSAEDVIRIYQYLAKNDIQVWLNGGWGIGAFLGEQTHFHKDLEASVLVDDLNCNCEFLSQKGYSI